MATFPPRMSRKLLSGRESMSTPSRTIRPESGANGLLFSLRIARAAGVAAALTSFVARSDGGTTSSPRACHTPLLLHGLAQPVADQVEAQNRTDDHHSGKHG